MHELVLQQKYFKNLTSISQFLETWISTGNTDGEIPNFEIKYLKNDKS